MPNMSGSFTGTANVQTSLSLRDTPNHVLNVAEISGAQKSADELWNNSAITYWGITDMVDGKGRQSGYYVNVHTGGDRDAGTFEGKLTVSGNQINVEGSWKLTSGTGKFSGATGGGTFKTKFTPPGVVECSWDGMYELAAKAGAH